MSDFAIVTDTAAELLEELSVKLDIHMIPMEFTMSGVSYQHDAGYRQMDAKTFYRRLRDGEMATTSAINPGQYVEYLTPILAGGQDVLLLVFSSGLSSTYQNSLLAAEELRAQFPDRKLYVVDTLAPSGGQALLVYHAALRRQEGASLEETRDWVEENKLHLAHWFTVDDLMFLKRGGRGSDGLHALHQTGFTRGRCRPSGECLQGTGPPGFPPGAGGQNGANRHSPRKPDCFHWPR